MSNKNLSSEATEMLQGAGVLQDELASILDILTEIDPADLVVTDEMALATFREILDDIPPVARGLYPEDDMLAAIAYAPIYYRMKY